MEQAVLEAVKIHDGYKVVGWNHVCTVDDLPDEYFMQFPLFYEDVDERGEDVLVVIKSLSVEMRGSTANIHIQKRQVAIGEAITTPEFEELLGMMKTAGSRLADIEKAVSDEEKHTVAYPI